jgi:hypothetical protein
MYLTGYEDMPLGQIKDFRQWRKPQATQIRSCPQD